MLNRNRSTASTTDASTAGMLSSLSHALPNPSGPLARSARALAHRLSHGTSNRDDLDDAAALLARMLDETDCGVCFDEDGLLDESFDV